MAETNLEFKPTIAMGYFFRQINWSNWVNQSCLVFIAIDINKFSLVR